MTLKKQATAIALAALLITPALGSNTKQWSWAQDPAEPIIYNTTSLGIENIVPRVINSVVAITTMNYVEEVNGPVPEIVPVPEDQEENNNPLNDFLEESNFIPVEQELQQAGHGTGFFVGKNLIVTNHHVIDGGVQDEYLIRLKNKSWHAYKARLISADKDTDIAILEIINPDSDIMNIVPLTFAPSLPRLGEPVFAIGHPHGLMWSVTQGVTSYLNRKINNIWQSLVQTDTAVNPGNSGGPLFNLRGKVVGVNVMIIGPGAREGETPNETGLNFAVTSEVTSHVISELLQYDRVRRPRLGVGLQQNSDLNLPRGIIVTEIEPGSPAELADLRVDDIISRVNKIAIKSSSDFFDWYALQMPGNKVTLGIVRGNEYLNILVTLDERISEK
jgi:serine protease Do